MAKKEKEPQDDGYKFEVPDFDEDEFIHKELVSFRTTGILFVWGILAALVSWFAFELLDGKNGWYIGLGIMAFFGWALRFVYARFNIDISHFGRREWLGTAFLMFFTWLAFFLVFLNPPISDHAEPQVVVIMSPPFQMAGGPVGIDVFYEDNHKIAEAAFTLTHGNGTVITDFDDLEDLGGGHYRTVLAAPVASQYRFEAMAEDPHGLRTTVHGNLSVSGHALRVGIEDEGIKTGDPLTVILAGDQLPLNVYVQLENKRIYLAYNENEAAYLAPAALPGWNEGPNTFTVVAEFDAQYYGLERVEPSRVIAGPFNTTVTGASGSGTPVEAQPTTSVSPNVQRTPGPELAVLAIGLVVVAVRKRR